MRHPLRWFASQGPIILAFVLLAVTGLASAVYQVLDESNEARHDRDQQAEAAALQAEVEALKAELSCRATESSEANRLEGEIGREGWLAMTIWARTGDSGHPRIVEAAERTEALYRELGPALVQRSEAVEECD